MKNSPTLKDINFIVLVACISLLSGCATTASINYKVDSPKQATKNISVKVEEVVDDRPAEKRGVIGDMLGGYGNVVGQVSEPPTLLADLKKALEGELSNAGYALTGEESGILIQPALKFLSCDTSNTGKAHMRMQMVVRESGQDVINQMYDAQDEAWNMVGYAANEAITATTKKLVRQFITDLDHYVKS